MSYLGIFFLNGHNFYVIFRSFNDSVKYIRSFSKSKHHSSLTYSLYCCDISNLRDLICQCILNDIEDLTDIYLLEFGYITIEEANERRGLI